MRALEPSRDSALIIRVELPPGLEALRRRHVADAVEGVPAHVTLLYPFAEPTSLFDAIHERVAAIVAGHRAWSMTLAGCGRWPDTLYATVEPDAAVRALQGELAGAFPSLPLYGDPGLPFEPHVTVVEGPGVSDPAVAEDPAWAELPIDEHVADVQLIVRTAGRWRVDRGFPLAGATAR